MGNATIVFLLRKKGALDEGKEPPAAVGHSEYRSSDDDSEMGDLRLPHKGEESVHPQTGLQRRRSSSSSASELFSMPERDVDRTTKCRLRSKLSRKVILPLGEQQEHLDFDLVECNDTDLCAKCNTIDLDKAFSLRDADCSGRVIAELGRINRTWGERECPMCQLIAAVSPRWKVASGGDIEEEDDCELALVAFSSTGTWLCHNLLVSWQHFTGRWIDTMFLGVVPRSMRDITKHGWKDDLASFVFKSGFIGRLGSNCEHRTRAITVTRVQDGVDFAAAKGWIACCREEPSRLCNPQTLARVPHFRLIDCTTRRIVQQGDQVPLYVALSYVWEAASSGEKSKLKHGDSDLPRDGLDIGESVEAVVEDAIRVALGLGYGFLWVDRYCILQGGGGKVKEEQLQSMDLVYANAEVTLVAMAGQASSSGLPGVSSRCPRVSQPSVRIKSHAITLIPPDPALQIKSSTWMTRGWTFQEGLLARRRLFFSESEMSFECRDLLAREAIRLPSGVQRQMGHLGRRLMEPSWIYGSLAMASSRKGGIDLFDLVAEYTRRNLTYQSDALNAMLGILQAYATRKRSPNRFYGRRRFGASIDGGRDNPELALAGFIGALCWTLRSPGVRRPGFPSWSWTGWHGAVDFPPGEYTRIAAFADGFDVEVSIVLADGVTPMPWSDYYGRLRIAAAMGIRSNPIFSQHHMLDITANIIIPQFYWRSGMKLTGIACAGDDMCRGYLALTQSDSPPSPGDNEIGFVPSLRRRLLEESWLGIVLGRGSYRFYVLVVQEMPPSTIGAISHWERVGLLTIDHSTLKSEMLERRKLRLA
ncbi:hypothetical protein LCI18_014346 [Fusarium solani-melongenae]|uniref:Uncharacterized protein n=1 Tax=Fusarium solani subsp. cucurbitae TaxID=2747967 RepID=A0ACD3ZQQ7_FUSSC|nr:hypothetical protein LCI18_014346 [Fusarium solani-melongenae]